MAAEAGRAGAPEEGSPACVGLREPSARLYDGGAKNSWTVYASCVPDVPSRCRHQTPATHSSLSLPGGEALFGWAAGISGPQPTLTSYLARAAVEPQSKERCKHRPNALAVREQEGTWTHGLGKKTAPWSWGRWTEVADAAADTEGPGVPALAHRQTRPHCSLFLHGPCKCKSCVSRSDALCGPMDCSPPGSSVVGFPRQECWSGLPFPSPRSSSTRDGTQVFHIAAKILYRLSHQGSRGGSNSHRKPVIREKSCSSGWTPPGGHAAPPAPTQQHPSS